MAKGNYVALYKEGREQPIGAVREDWADEIIVELKAFTQEDYRAEPITQEQAQQIRNEITNLDGLEKFFDS